MNNSGAEDSPAGGRDAGLAEDKGVFWRGAR